jgi:hypothetical protein
MTSDEKTSVPSLMNYIHSDLFTIGNISKSVTLKKTQTEPMVNGYQPPNSWEAVINYLPLEFFEMIESYNTMNTPTTKMYQVEAFDKTKYRFNPKKYAYDKYGLTNMWRPIMILNKCQSILEFDMDYIKYYDMTNFSKIISVFISRMQHSEALRS